MSVSHRVFNPSWPGVSRPSIARASASDGVFLARCSTNTLSRASPRAPDGWPLRRAAMTTEGDVTVRPCGVVNSTVCAIRQPQHLVPWRTEGIMGGPHPPFFCKTIPLRFAQEEGVPPSHCASHKRRGYPPPTFSTNKTNNSVLRPTGGQGGPPPVFRGSNGNSGNLAGRLRERCCDFASTIMIWGVAGVSRPYAEAGQHST